MSLPIDLAQLSKESVILEQINRNYPNWNAKRKKKEWKTKGGGDRALDSYERQYQMISEIYWIGTKWRREEMIEEIMTVSKSKIREHKVE